MIRKAFFLTIALLLPVLSQAQVKLLRHPTYANGKVAFSYLGDLWIANENGSGVQRLTDNQARDIYPRFSPDGNWIAFSSNREGNYDVYVIPTTGGKPRQRRRTIWQERPRRTADAGHVKDNRRRTGEGFEEGLCQLPIGADSVEQQQRRLRAAAVLDRHLQRLAVDRDLSCLDRRRRARIGRSSRKRPRSSANSSADG